MTLQTLFNEAVKLIDDYPNIGDYATDYFGDATAVITDLVNGRIGVKAKEFYHELDETVYYTPDDENFKPVPLPDDLTADRQILSVQPSTYAFTQTNDGTFYILVPKDYRCVTVQYVPKVTAFTSMSDELPIEDDAVYMVARYGLAELLAAYNNKAQTERLAVKYQQGKAAWRGRDYNFGEIQEYYGY